MKKNFMILKNQRLRIRIGFLGCKSSWRWKDELCQALEFPRPYDPIYKEWKNVFEQMTIDGDTVIVGHSCGGGFLARYFSEYSEMYPKKLILVAPWLDPEKELTTDFFDFEIDPELATKTEVHIFSSSDDDASLLKSFEMFKEKLPGAIWHEFSDKGHFCEKEFPELLEILK